MFISDEEKGNILIGRAVMDLIFNREEVTAESLLGQLRNMAEKETDDECLLLMYEVRRWLQGYLSLSSISPERPGWLSYPPASALQAQVKMPRGQNRLTLEEDRSNG